MSHSFRPGLDAIAAYRPGKPAPVNATGQSIKLSSNESPVSPLPSVVAAVLDALPTALHRYPNLAAPELIEELSRRFDVDPGCITVGAGSVEVAAQLMHALTAPGDEVIYAWRSFEAYPILARVSGAVPVEVPLDSNSRHDLDAMGDAVTDKTRLIFICNPNNPTGTVITATELTRFLSRVPKNVLVVIDEAYVHFNLDPESAQGIHFFREYPNVAVLHTFSKAYGLAGLRVGYVIARKEVVVELRKTAVPFAVSALAQVAAVVSLSADAEHELRARTQLQVSARERMQHALADMGLPVVKSHANFVWLPLGRASHEYEELCARAGISVRCFAEEGIRVSVGTPEENLIFIEAMQNAIHEQHV